MFVMNAGSVRGWGCERLGGVRGGEGERVRV